VVSAPLATDTVQAWAATAATVDRPNRSNPHLGLDATRA
jgi:hypothetical protein